MKRLLMLIMILLASSSLFAQDTPDPPASKLRVGVTLGVAYGIGDLYDLTDPQIGGNAGLLANYDLSTVLPNLSADLTAVFTYFNGKDVPILGQYSFSFLESTMGVNYRVIPQLSVLAGAGYYKFIIDTENGGSAGEQYVGAYAGVAFNATDALSIRATAHIPNFEADALYTRLNVAYTFAIPGI